MDSIRVTGEGGQAAERYRFDGIVVDAVAHTFSRDGEFLPVEPKAFAVLLVLLRHAGELVGHEQLLDAVWGHRHVTPGVLTRAIALLRVALADDSHVPRYIQTQHALGYRFIGHLHEVADAGVASPAEASAQPRVAESLPATPADAPFLALAENAPESVPPVPTQKRPLPLHVAPSMPIPLLRRIPWPWLAVGTILLALVGAWAWRQRMLPDSTATGDVSIAVMPFTSLSSGPDDRNFAEGLAVEMHDALAGVPGLKVAAHRSGGAQNGDARALGRILGVASVLDASVRREGDRVRINARLSDTKTGFTLWTDSYDRETTDVFAMQSEIANEVVEELLGHLPGDHQALAGRFTPPRDFAAYDAYLRGLAELQRPSDAGGNQRAVRYFQQSLAADKGFARAQAGICRAEIVRLESEHDAEAFGRARQACERALAMDPALREVDLAMAEIARVNGEPAKAIVLYQQAMEDPALRADAYVGLARTYGAQDQHQRALEYFQRAAALRPGDAQIYSQLGYHYYLRGDLAQAIQAYATATTLEPRDSGLWSSLGGLYLASGDGARAARAFDTSLSIEPNYAALSNRGTMKFEAGDYAGAAGMYRRAAELQPDSYMTWGNLGDALAAVPATAAQAADPYRRAARLAQDYALVKSDDAEVRAALSWYRANLGEAVAARADLAAADALGTQPGEVALWGAQTLALLGDGAGARVRIRRAHEAGIPSQRIFALPVLRAYAANTRSLSGEIESR